ncbi:MAG: ABC transporter [Micavibrio aeruginosavorus]|uniref:ABC transporter n=1 Tax=Micavibrio aeruginosavorus TaxID=349221 RepID=A0A2W5Q0V5_9BACT|nr:MAG: ABC transporter [Micavibrio aeruginosavorus]
MSDILLKTQDLKRVYQQGGEALTILHDVNIEIKAGEIVALVGPSGSGKSTLLQMTGLLDKPTSGKVFIAGQEAKASGDDEHRTALRRKYLGFVYQFHYLLPEFTALENVVIPQMISGVNKKDAEERGVELLTRLRLDHRLTHRPARLSGGEQQRVAIARALANNCKLLLADEPTGNLDPETSNGVFEMLTDLVRSSGIGAMIATHNMDLAERMDRILELKAGRIISY